MYVHSDSWLIFSVRPLLLQVTIDNKRSYGADAAWQHILSGIQGQMTECYTHCCTYLKAYFRCVILGKI